MSIIPHHISCGVFIKHVLNRFQESTSNNPDSTLLLSITVLKLIKQTDLTWKEFQQKCMNVAPFIFSLCTKEIHQITSLEGISTTMNSFEELYTHKQSNRLVTRTSVIGLFLRRIVLSFKKLSFQEAHNFLNSLHNYTDLKKYIDANRTLNDDSSLSISMLDQSLIDGKENIPLSQQLIENMATTKSVELNVNKIERFIREQIDLISETSNSAMNPSDLQVMIRRIISNQPNIKDVYYLSFLNYLRLFDANGAANALKKYFDYKDFDAKAVDNDLTEVAKHSLKFKRFRYSALNLAMMYCVQHHYMKAEGLLEEAIKMSQATNDQNCLNQAMFWLKYVKTQNRTFSPTDKANTMEKLDLFLSEEEPFSSFLDIDFLSFLQIVKEDGLSAIEQPSKLFFILSQITMSFSTLVSNYADLTYFALLQSFGLINCAFHYPYILLLNQDDLFQSSIDQLNEEAKVLSYIDLAICHQYNSLYEESLEIINYCKSLLPIYSTHQSKLSLFEGFIEFERGLNERDIDIVMQKMSSVMIIDKDEGLYLSFITDIMNNNSSEVVKIIKDVLNKNENTSTLSVQYKVKLMLLNIEIFLMSNEPSLTIDQILEVIILTEKHHLMYAKVTAQLYLIQILLYLKRFKKAQEVISETLIHTISFGSAIQKGVLFFLNAVCLREKNATKDEKERKLNLLDAISLLDKAFLVFQKGNMLAQMKNVHFERAIVYNELGYIRERNESSAQFRILHEKIGHFPNVLMF